MYLAEKVIIPLKKSNPLLQEQSKYLQLVTQARTIKVVVCGVQAGSRMSCFDLNIKSFISPSFSIVFKY